MSEAGEETKLDPIMEALKKVIKKSMGADGKDL